jgi:hypothetical protein
MCRKGRSKEKRKIKTIKLRKGKKSKRKLWEEEHSEFMLLLPS